MKKVIEGISGFFPVQLIVLQFKRNYLSLAFWAILFAIIFKSFFLGFGVPYLFLAPEYLSELSFWSYLIFGFSIGGFIMAYNTYSYVMLGKSFPFLAALRRPFLKFSINNAVIPILFIGSLVYQIISHQRNEEDISLIMALVYVLALFLGIAIFLFISSYYFFKTNKSLDLVKQRKTRDLITSWIPGFKQSNPKKYYPSTFLDIFTVATCRDISHYSQTTLNKVYSQNHINAIIFEVLIILSFLSLGLFQDFKIFQIPAGASIMLLFTLAQMVISAFYNWFKEWALFVMVLILVVVNALSSNFESLQFKSQAIGLDYTEKASFQKYDFESRDITVSVSDLHRQEKILDNWKEKTGKEKPKLIIVNSSGGGIRSALWNFILLQELEKATDGQFSNQLQMITGASGGMIGSAYFRELMYDSTRLETDTIYRQDVSNDLLNMVSASLVTNDLFLKFKKAEFNGKEYIKDRGFSFEENLVKNFNGYFNKPLSSYQEPEYNAEIPQMIFAPTIIDDGKRMLISSQPLGYLSNVSDNGISENIEYIKLLKDNNADSTRLASVLRMNATFPYILPMVTLPTDPELTIMDAGLRDNYGGKLTMEYILELKKWIKENTSGVIVIQIRDIKKSGSYSESDQSSSMFKRFVRPVGNMQQNLFKTQDYDQEEMFAILSKDLNFPLRLVSFNLLDKEGDMSLSWHLTRKEKQEVINSFNRSNNQTEFRKLVELIKN